MAKYLYLPFNSFWDDDVISAMPGTAPMRDYELIERPMGEINLFLSDEERSPLRGVTPTDALFISAHGSITDPTSISNSQDNSRSVFAGSGGRTYDRMTHNDLADVLESEGLNKRHKKILVGSCVGGGLGTFSDSTGVAVPPGDCFAGLLARSLGVRGYSDVCVGGYAGVVEMIGGSALRITMPNPTGTRINTVGAMGTAATTRWFGSNGVMRTDAALWVWDFFPPSF